MTSFCEYYLQHIPAYEKKPKCSFCVGGDYGSSGVEVAGSQPHCVLHDGGGGWREATN